MIVVGGTYGERCEDPAFERLRGSGLRAAIALRTLADDLQLQTSIHEAEQEIFEVVKSAFGGFTATIYPRTAPISFDYFTPLSPPAVKGRGATTSASFAAAARTVLRFGMLESGHRATITADTLVVDPQGDATDIPLGDSTFKRLAIVANERETHKLGESDDLELAAKQLLAKTGADVVVSKCGARGALVTTSDGTEAVGCFPTDHVVPIGSGDVYAAAFAWAYGERSDDVVTAARFASRSTAHWCATPAEPALQPSYVELAEVAFDIQPVVYLAGPFFGLGQTWLIDLAHSALIELGSKPFSPLHDVGRGGPEVAIADLDGLDNSASVLALLDEFDPGTVFEVGYAIRNGLPVVGYLHPRPSGNLVMLEGSGVELVTDLASAVYRAIWRGLPPR